MCACEYACMLCACVPSPNSAPAFLNGCNIGGLLTSDDTETRKSSATRVEVGGGGHPARFCFLLCAPNGGEIALYGGVAHNNTRARQNPTAGSASSPSCEWGGCHRTSSGKNKFCPSSIYTSYSLGCAGTKKKNVPAVGKLVNGSV